MDVASCCILTLAEVFLWQHLPYTARAGPREETLRHSITLFTVQYLTLKFYRIFLYHRYFSPLRHVPGPKDGHWLLGQTLALLRAPTPTALHLEWMHQHPTAPLIRYLAAFNTEVLVCNSLAACRDVLQTHCYAIRKSDWYMRAGKDILGKGLIAQEGDVHRAHRRVLSGPFSFAKIRQLEPLFKDKAKGLSAVLRRACREGEEEEEEEEEEGGTGVIDCTDIFTKAFLDIIGVATLGKELSQLDTVGLEDQGTTGTSNATTASGRQESSFHRAYNEFFAPPEKRKQLLTFLSGFYPVVRWLPLQANRDFKSAMAALHGSIIALIRERLAERRTLQAQGHGADAQAISTDLLTFMVDEILQGEAAAEALAEEVLLGDLLEFIGAGHETSANTLSWALLVLAQDHAIQDKLRAEIAQLLAHDADPSYAEVEKLPYLDNFLKEVLRVYPPANTLFRQTSTDLTIEGTFIPQNTLIDMCCAMPQQNPTIWGYDADAHLVNPDRWDGLGSHDQRLNPFAMEAFSNGPRICLGKGFALLELKTIVVELVRHFRFVRVERSFTLANPSLVLRPNGLEIRLEMAAL